MASTKMPLKLFWETLERRLSESSPDQLRDILRAMAHGVTPGERQAFLGRLNPPKQVARALEQSAGQDELLADIDDLLRELRAQKDRGDDWDAEHDWHGYDEGDSLGPYDEFVEPVADLLDRADTVFDLGNLSLARQAYEKLFRVFKEEDAYGRGVRPHDLENVDFDEALARYLRAVYETEPPERRPESLFSKMRETRSLGWGIRPMLEHVLQISRQALPERTRFLADWERFLREQEGADADAWLREAIRLARGTEGLETLARQEGATRPRVYLDWLAALEQEGKPRAVLAVARQALAGLPAGLPIRAAVADHLCRAAAALKDAKAIRKGRWEAFAAKPELPRLLDLWEAIPAGSQRLRGMAKAVQHLEDYLTQPRKHAIAETSYEQDNLARPASVDKSILTHACLLAGQWDSAQGLAARQNTLGWSHGDNPQGFVVPFFLVRLSAKAFDDLPASLAQLWDWGLSATIGLGYLERYGGHEGRAESSLKSRLQDVYLRLGSPKTWNETRQKANFAWCLDVVQKRIDAIVEGQHRGSYRKAAVLAVACAEVQGSRGESKRAQAWLGRIRGRFPRHRAFQDEMKAAMRSSELELRI